MRERVRQLNGAFSIRSSTCGTTVDATLPTTLNEAQNGNQDSGLRQPDRRRA
jgi:signal transduction histidine kinase